MSDETDIDTTNDCLVSWSTDGIAILLPPMGPIPKAKALRLAAWIVAIADPLGEDFAATLEAVGGT